jgi:hypothetical protein
VDKKVEIGDIEILENLSKISKYISKSFHPSIMTISPKSNDKVLESILTTLLLM